MNCKLCNSATQDYKPMDFRRHTDWLKCTACGFEFVHPSPTQEYLDEYYASNEYRIESHSELDLSDGKPNICNVHQEDDRAWQWFRYIPHGYKTMLDVGSGAGASIAAFQQEYPDMYIEGVEPCPWGRLYDAYEKLEDAPGPYDVVTCFHVLEHVLDPLAFLAELSPLFTGQLCLETPIYPGSRAWPHMLNFSLDTLMLAMELADMPAELCDDNYHIKIKVVRDEANPET